MSTLDNFGKDAKRWFKALRAGDRAAQRRLGRAYPAALVACSGRTVATRPLLLPPDTSRVTIGWRDIVVAFEMGQADAMARLQTHYGGVFTWEELRANVRMCLDAIPDDEKPDGYFALPHARRLVARQAGFASWSALMES